MERKKKKPKPPPYTTEVLEQALQELLNTKAPVRRISIKYQIPRTTLLHRVQKGNYDALRRRGPIPLLGTDAEKEIVEWLIHITKCGFLIKKPEIMNTAQILINENLSSKFKNGKPGVKWYKNFLDRHLKIANLQRDIRKSFIGRATEESLRLWFYDLEAFLEHRKLTHILDRPENIFNLDEIEIVYNPDTEEVLGPKALKNLYKKSRTGFEEDMTVMVVSNANGDLGPPCLSFPYGLPPSTVLEKMPQDWCLGNSDSDWTRSFVFFEYITNYFNDWIESNKVERPVLLLVNAQKSRLTLSLCAICEELQIILYAIPPNASHIIRPTDGGVFCPLKMQWNRIVKEFLDRDENFEVPCVTRANICQLLHDTWNNADLASNIRDEFQKCGLYPFNPDALDYSKCFERLLY